MGLLKRLSLGKETVVVTMTTEKEASTFSNGTIMVMGGTRSMRKTGSGM
jgi:hypothetical protein